VGNIDTNQNIRSIPGPGRFSPNDGGRRSPPKKRHPKRHRRLGELKPSSQLPQGSLNLGG
jgi:hypothetical protein